MIAVSIMVFAYAIEQTEYAEDRVSVTPETQPNRVKQRISAISENPLLARTPASAFKLSPEIKNKLRTFSKVSKKIFHSDADQLRLRNTVADENLLRSFSELLTTDAQNDLEFAQAQNSAIEILLLADSQGSAVARQVLREIIQDAQIENDQVDIAQKTALAEIKADILYQWSSQNINAETEIPGLLPGPRSQKIWNNILETQKNLRLESLAEHPSL